MVFLAPVIIGRRQGMYSSVLVVLHLHYDGIETDMTEEDKIVSPSLHGERRT